MLAQEEQFDEILDYAMVRCELVRPPHYIVVMSSGSQALLKCITQPQVICFICHGSHILKASLQCIILSVFLQVHI